MIFLEDNCSSITYDENWQSVAEPEYPVIREPSPEPETYDDGFKQPRQINVPKQYVVTFQLAVCLLLALAAFVVKGIGGEVYQTVREWYYTQLNSTVIFDKNDRFDLSTLFGKATADEV